MPGSRRNEAALVKLHKLFPDADAAFLMSVRAAAGSASRNDLWKAYRLLFDKMIYEAVDNPGNTAFIRLTNPKVVPPSAKISTPLQDDFPIVTPQMLIDKFSPK